MDEIQRAKDAGAEFLLTEARLAITFLDIADTSVSSVVKRRNIKSATVALATIDHFLGKLGLSASSEASVRRAMKPATDRLALMAAC